MSGPRNSSAKEDGVDAVLATLANKSPAGVVSNTRLAFRKVRGGRSGEEIPYSARMVEIPQDDGDPVTTRVIEWDERPAEVRPDQRPKKLSKSLAIFKRALDLAFDGAQFIHPFPGKPKVLAVTRDAVRQEFLKTYPADETDTKRKAFERCEIEAAAWGLMTSREIENAGVSTTFFWRSPKDE